MPRSMPKRCEKEVEKSVGEPVARSDVNLAKIDQNFLLELVIGSANVKRWCQLKDELSCGSHENFAAVLLDLAQKHVEEKQKTRNFDKVQPKHCGTTQDVPEIQIIPINLLVPNDSNPKQVSDNVDIKTEEDQTKLAEDKYSFTDQEIVPQVTPTAEETNVDFSISHENENRQQKHRRKIRDALYTEKGSKQIKSNEVKHKKKASDANQHKTAENVKAEKQKKKTATNYDIRKAPELDEQVEKPEIENHVEEINENHLEVTNKRVAIKIKMCTNCGSRHLQEQCPLQNPYYVVSDSITLPEWNERYRAIYEKEMSSENNDDMDSKLDPIPFASLSLPSLLYLADTNTSHGIGVFTNTNIKEFTQLGPLLGKIIREVDISEDFNMRDLWQVYSDKTHTFLNTENLLESNWMRFVRPASSRDTRNVAAVSKAEELFFITTADISAGKELVYWQDDVLSVTKKKMEKATCGGCNMTFAHPLYYRTHCSIFHDMRYSLTIRKYHCKVCGAAVLGKENIMKHAAELHNGQGAYQCQFCKKFFLRLNYLEMHRTYGCSANPHRSRPLCDFCGRKFCQPQKLKVHIKRMHSDISEVLKEFQCKNCLKLLGSRAALQRHMKEVHNKQVNGACSCSRCGKLFQNKSNLKIHMLTHSGIKPFKCDQDSCTAAFTTKQCLQFHYKKAHGFTEDMMPKIKRSVDYTFEAYSGVEDQEMQDNHQMVEDSPNAEHNMSSNFDSFNEASDDENSRDGDENSLAETQSTLHHSPVPLVMENSSGLNSAASTLESYGNVKILSKGSKKWLGEQPLQILKTDMYELNQNHMVQKTDTNSNITIHAETEESQAYDQNKLNLSLNSYARHESSNASLLVEAALDSVCAEPNIDIDVDSSPGSTDVLVNNLCTLTHPDGLPDVTYNHGVDIAESRDINLISPSVNEQMSVPEDLNSDLRHDENIGIDYSNFHHNDFSPANSPGMQHRSSFARDYIDAGRISPQNLQSYASTQQKHVSPGSSPPRYNFGHSINPDHVSSDDSNGIGVQNLSLNNPKSDAQLDLSIYKASYNFETNFQWRKDFSPLKINLDPERKQVYVLELNHDPENLPESEQDGVDNLDSTNVCDKDFEGLDGDDIKHKGMELSVAARGKYHEDDLVDIRNKQLELDLNLRAKGYDITSRSTYESGTDNDFRIKAYDPIDSIDARTNLLESTDFRIDRNFEPLVLNTAELQGLDMSARSYHNYHTSSTVQNLNRYHHLYTDVERPTVDLRLNYSPPPPSYSHADVLRVVSLDLTSPGRHSVDLSLRPNPLHIHQIGNTRLLADHGLQTNRILADHNRLSLDQTRFGNVSDLASSRQRLLETGSRILSDHSTSRLLSNDQVPTNHIIAPEQSRILQDETRLMVDESRLLEQGRLLTDSRLLPPTGASTGSISPVPYTPYSVSPPTPYHPTALTARPHATSPTPPYHYSTYY